MATEMFHQLLVSALHYVPQPVVWRFSRRYIAGTELADACQAVQELNAGNCRATIDVLGEDSTSAIEVMDARDLYLVAIRDIHTNSLDCGVSVKLSEMGLRFDDKLCREAMRELLSSAEENRTFVRIDMEDSTVTTATLDVYKELRTEFENVGIVIQACLRRSERDVAELLHGGPTDVRLCKGIYIEPEQIAYRDPGEVRESFSNLLERLFLGGASFVGIATHDPLLVAHAEETIERLEIPTDRYEFQMLLGVGGSLRRKLVDKGHPLRVYVPFGEMWYPYSMRRLRENPHIAGHIVRNLFRRD